MLLKTTDGDLPAKVAASWGESDNLVYTIRLLNPGVKYPLRYVHHTYLKEMPAKTIKLK